MIVATAGHVDHGKTSLVKALTDIDTDSLAEEKRRGMSIDLGFAHAEIGVSAQGQPLTLGFVDVPGHERFVRNMLAGVAAIDLALLVVAADDGVMPQTREHLAILLLLGVPRCVVALTKVDRVAPERLAQVGREVADLLVARGQLAHPAGRVLGGDLARGDSLHELEKLRVDEGARGGRGGGVRGVGDGDGDGARRRGRSCFFVSIF